MQQVTMDRVTMDHHPQLVSHLPAPIRYPPAIVELQLPWDQAWHPPPPPAAA